MPNTVWKGYLSFGLVSFPVQLFTAARAESVRFRMLHKKDLSRVREILYCAEENTPIDRSEVVKGYETGKDQYVVVESEELKAIAPPTASAMDILQFVHANEVDPIYFESSYYLAPQDKNAKPFTLFMAALKDSKQEAIAKIAMHNREHIVLIRPAETGLLLHTLYYSNELNSANQAAPPVASYTPQEFKLAQSLIAHLAAPFKPEQFKDTYRENVERLIESKQKGQKVTSIKQSTHAPVIDIMDALKRSIESIPPANPETKRKPMSRATKKPAGQERVA